MTKMQFDVTVRCPHCGTVVEQIADAQDETVMICQNCDAELDSYGEVRAAASEMAAAKIVEATNRKLET